ncbi:hypothetical protein E5288_WYG005572 [Bos mutus]|uniref:Uncharacterized protein n=1 Tax=Bos mutus TaxID=72004 RepID=A0A6B0RLJ6_9CETA|nr:hypothetical protein [Bos mutus]
MKPSEATRVGLLFSGTHWPSASLHGAARFPQGRHTPVYSLPQTGGDFCGLEGPSQFKRKASGFRCSQDANIIWTQSYLPIALHWALEINREQGRGTPALGLGETSPAQESQASQLLFLVGKHGSARKMSLGQAMMELVG